VSISSRCSAYRGCGGSASRQETAAERKFFPGYVLAKMDMTDATWHLVKTTPKVTGFLGGKGIRPQPISEREAAAIFSKCRMGWIHRAIPCILKMARTSRLSTAV